MAPADCAGPYTLYTANWTIPGGESHAARIDIASGGNATDAAAVVDDFNHAVKLPGACRPLRLPPPDRCTTLPVALAPPTQTPPPVPAATASFVMSEHTTTAAAAAASKLAAAPSDAPSRLPSGGRPYEFEPGLLTAARGFFASLVSDLAGFFG